LPRVLKDILGIHGLTEVKCCIRKNEKFLDGIWDLSATRREAEFVKILARDTVLGQEIACGQALQGALAGGGGAEKGMGACNYGSGIEKSMRNCDWRR